MVDFVREERRFKLLTITKWREDSSIEKREEDTMMDITSIF